MRWTSGEHMRQRRSDRFYSPRSGTAAVELALLLPLLVLCFALAVDYARIFYYTVTLANCARNGATYGSADVTRAVDQAGIATAARADAVNLNSQQLTVASTTDGGTTPTYVEVTVSYPFATIMNFPGVPSSTSISRKARMAVAPTLPNFN